MNFLAHLHLAPPTPASRIGNLMPDLVRGRLPENLHPEVAAGVRLHRRVDAFTDTHPVFGRSRARLRTRHGLFAGILVDVFYDHFLACRWQRHHDQPLHRFIASVHDDFEAGAEFMPPAMQRVLVHMREQDWLSTYAHLPGLELTLRRMSQRFTNRFKRDIRLHHAVEDLVVHYAELAADFNEFYPELWAYARREPARTTVVHQTLAHKSR